MNERFWNRLKRSVHRLMCRHDYVNYYNTEIKRQFCTKCHHEREHDERKGYG